VRLAWKPVPVRITGVGGFSAKSLYLIRMEFFKIEALDVLNSQANLLDLIESSM